MATNNEFGDFLRSRRAGLTPDDVGLPWDPAGRRVAGLRRTEVAQLAGVSAEYYARLEQGRAKQPSEQVLHAVADALRFDDTERRHLFTLAGTASTTPRNQGRTGTLRPALRQVLESLELAPAYVRDDNLDIVAGNAMWKLTFPDVARLPRHERNMARWTLLDPVARTMWHDWETVAREHVQVLRVTAAAQPHNQRIATLIGELTMRSPEFTRWWAEHRVHQRTAGVKHIRHHLVGELELNYEIFSAIAQPDLSMLVYTAAPGSPSADRLRMLASWGHEPAQQRSKEAQQ